MTLSSLKVLDYRVSCMDNGILLVQFLPVCIVSLQSLNASFPFGWGE